MATLTKSTIIKYLLIIGLAGYSALMTKNFLDSGKEIRDLRDLHTTTVIQRDSISKVYELTTKQFNALVYEKDSLYTEALKAKDIKIKYLQRVSKIKVIDTILLDTPPVIEHVEVSRDTVINFSKPIKYAEIGGVLTIHNHKVDLILNSIRLNLSIVVTDYYDVIYWYNFRKRKQNGYNLIGFRNHYINKTSAVCKELEHDLPIEVIKIRK